MIKKMGKIKNLEDMNHSKKNIKMIIKDMKKAKNFIVANLNQKQNIFKWKNQGI